MKVLSVCHKTTPIEAGMFRGLQFSGALLWPLYIVLFLCVCEQVNTCILNGLGVTIFLLRSLANPRLYPSSDLFSVVDWTPVNVQ